MIAPPTIALQSPADNATFNFGQRVITAFTCQEGAGGPGLTDCGATVDDSDAELASGAALPTSIAGPHTLTVSAVSGDGQVVNDTVDYTVRPDNRFTVSHVKANDADRSASGSSCPDPAASPCSSAPWGWRGEGGGGGGGKVTFVPKGGVTRTIAVGGVSVS